jgi:hypothetical protein
MDVVTMPTLIGTVAVPLPSVLELDQTPDVLVMSEVREHAELDPPVEPSMMTGPIAATCA